MPDFSTTDVAAHVGQNVPNPLTTLSGIVALRNAQNQLKLFPLQVQQAQADVQAARLKNTAAQRDAFNAILASTKNNAEATTALARGAAAGVFDPDFATALAGGNIDDLSPDKWDTLRQQAIMAAGNQTEVGANFGTSSTVHTGAGTKTINTRVGPEGTEVSEAAGNAAFVPDQQSPTEQGSMLTYQGHGGETRAIAKSAVQDPSGHMIPNVKDADGNQLTDASGAFTTSLKPDDAAQIAKTAVNQADRSTALETAFEGSAQRQALLKELLQTNGEFRSGPGAAKWSGIVSEFNRIFGTNFDASPAAAQQVFGKIAQMISAQQRDTLGLPATNAGQSASEIASPNSAYSTKAIQAVAGQLLGNEELLQKKEAAWAKYHKAGGSYNGFIRQFNGAFDPRYFWDQYVPDDQKAEAGMNAAQKAAYEAARKRAMGLTF